LERYDTNSLQVASPARGRLANVFLIGVVDTQTSIEAQLAQVAQYPVERLAADLVEVWREEIPPSAAHLLRPDGAGIGDLVEELGDYWEAVIKPHWTRIRAVLDGDVAHRAARIAQGGISAMLSGLHPDLTLSADTLQLRSPAHQQHYLAGRGLLLIPSVFAWPRIIFGTSHSGQPTLIYSARGVGRLWESSASSANQAPHPDLAGLVGRTRAAILHMLATPKSTTDLAERLSQSAPTISVHLSILRQCGLVSSWPFGRRVFYQRTPLATSLMIASSESRSSRRS
jgi:DNA-binding transcriptional ArsR family regulator